MGRKVENSILVDFNVEENEKEKVVEEQIEEVLHYMLNQKLQLVQFLILGTAEECQLR